MKRLGISPGIGIGKVFLYKEIKLEVRQRKVEDADLEVKRFHNALEKSKNEIDKLYNKVLENLGEKSAEIFLAHRLILEDPEFIKGVEEKINNEKVNAEYAVKETMDFFISLFEENEDKNVSSRAMDLKDVSDRILRILLNIESVDLLSIDDKSIIVAKDLTPSDVATINKDMVVGIVTEFGGKNSHTSIMAKTLEIPAIAGIKNFTSQVKHGDTMIIDGDSGDVILNPTETELENYRGKIKEQELLKKN